MSTLLSPLRMRSVGLGFGIFVSGLSAQAQLVVNSQSNLPALAASITGPGVQILNPVINCHPEGFGEFSYTGSSLGLDEGVLLTSGRITETIGPNNVENRTFQQGTSGNTLLNVVTGRSTRDACLFEFDIIPSGDSLRFNFVLGSEEYNEWVGSQFNDVFGFFISGPGITGDPGIGSDRNIAIIPGTNLPVTINNVNNGLNSAYYFDNAGGQDIQYDGFTRGLYAEALVQPCVTYHLKLVVADASDRAFDSGVFIERIRSNQVTMTSHTLNGSADMVEGCNPGWVTFTRPTPRPTPLNLQYFLQGTATNGTDYSAIGNVNPAVVKLITIPANQTSVNVNVNPLADAATEPTEFLRFILGNPLCPAQALDTLIFNINDTLIANVTPTNARICRGDSVQFQITGGATYAWSPATGLSSTNSANPWAKPLVNTTYTITITDGTCTRTVIRSVRVSNPVISGVVTRPLCDGQSNGAVNLSHSGGVAPFTFNWSGPNSFTAATEDLVNVPAGTYTVNYSDVVGCIRTQSFNVGSPAVLNGTLTPSILPLGQNIACFNGTTGTLGLALTGGTAPYATSWNGPSGWTSTNQSIAGLGAGAYTASVTDANGCTFGTSYTLTQPTALAPVIGGVTNLACFGTNIGQASVTISGGVPPFNYSWNSAPAQTAAAATGLAAGNYTVTVTDGYACTSTATTTITGPAAALATSVTSTTNITCFGAANGSAAVSASGGTLPYAYSWNTTPVQTGNAATNLAPGTWICAVTDANGCTTTRNITITQPLAALSSSVSAQTNVACFGANTGSATVAVTGGTSPYTYSWNTTPVQTGATASTLPAGTVTCTITDARGCAATQNVSITQPTAALGSSISAQINVACFGTNTGSATVTVTGGTAPYSYSWNTAPVQTGATAINLSAGTRTCTITDANGCTTTRNVTITQPAAALSSSVGAQTNVGCFAANTGSATVPVSGGTAPYSFSWNTTPVQTSATANSLPAGSWTCTITDANGCSATRNVNITQPSSALSGSVSTQTNVGCFGASTGSATVAASGGTGPYSFSWNTAPVQTGATASNLAVGTWTCTIVDANACSATRTVTITQPAAGLSSSISSQTNVGCFGASTGNATVSVSGGTAPYTYSWNTSPVQTGATANDLPLGTRTCTITDANGCSTSQNVTITQPTAALSSSVSAQTNVGCFGANTGGATILAAGGTAPYTYSWNTAPAQTGATATNLTAGTWTCTIIDANGCSVTRNVIIIQPAAALTSSVSAQANVGCFGASTGSASINATGGTGPYTYSWNTTPVQTSSNATGLGAGTWTCTITDANGCTAIRNITITQPSAALGGSISAQSNVGCFGANTGSASIAVTGGTAPFSYGWNTTPVQTTSTASNLLAGTWICTITDANGCSTTRSVTIAQPAAALSSSVSAQTNVGCSGANTGSATIAVVGGTAPYAYSWNTAPVQTGATASNLNGGTWTCTVTDANGCSTTRNVIISQPAVALTSSVSAQTNVGCSGANTGSATVAASGGTAPYSYTWNTTPVQTSATASNLIAGTWTCTITDANGCTTNRNAAITQPSAALASGVIAQTNVGCFGASTGSASVSASGGTAPYTYSWNTTPVQTSSDAIGLPAGTWICIITDANGCSTTTAVTITQPAAALATSVTSQTNAGCFGANTGSASISVTGGTAPYAYSWNTSPLQTSATASNLVAGTWTCTVTDVNGCGSTRIVTITQPVAALSTSVSAQTNVGCFGTNTGSATIVVVGGTAPYSYSWNTTPIQTSATTSDLIAGTWTCTIIDANGCSTTRNIIISQPAAALSSSVSAQTNVSCFGANTGSATVAVSGGTISYSYSWNTTPVQTSATASNLVAGTWTCTITDANGCSTISSATITQPSSALSSNLSDQTNVGCFGANSGSATVAGSGGTAPYSYSWNTVPVQTNATASNLIAGTWTCTISDANGCTTARSVTISQPSATLSSSVSAQTNVGCFGANTGSASVSVSGGTAPYSYSWNTTPVQTNATATNLTAGTWICSISDANGCSITRNVVVTQPAAALSSSVSAQTNVGCFGANTGSATVSVSGGTAPYSYSWNTTPVQTSATASNLIAGTWTCTISDANGCSTTRNVTIAQPAAALAASLSAQTNAGCFGANTGSAAVSVTGGTAPYTYNWNTAPVQTSAAVNNLTAGTWTCTISDANGCSTTQSVAISQPIAALSSSVSAQTNVGCFGANTGTATVAGSGGSAPYSYSWNTSPVQTNATASNLIAGTWICTISDANGCATTRNVTIAQPAAAIALSGSVTAATCGGATNGAVDATVSGGTTPYTIAWSGPNGFTSATIDITTLEAGVYLLSVTDANGCSASSSFNVGQPGLFSIAGTPSNFNGFAVSCLANNDGSMAQTVTGGTGPYTHSWTGPNGFTASTEDISGLAAGSYIYVITDANGCSTSATYPLTAPTPLATSLSTPSVNGAWNIACTGAATGSINATLSGGIAPLTTVWNGPSGFTSNSEDITGLIAGAYTLTVADGNGCDLVSNITLTEPAALAATGNMIAAVGCFGANTGSASVSVSGGTAPYSYSWNTTPVQTNATATNLTAGTWTCSVSDANGCSIASNVVVAQPVAALAVNVTSTSDVLCFGTDGGSATALASGGTGPYGYSWNSAPTQSTATAIDLLATAYTVTATDVNGCTATANATIAQPSTPVDAFFDQITNETCSGANDGIATITLSGGSNAFTVTWDTQPPISGITATGLAPGLYTVSVIDNNGCSDVKSYPVTIQGSVTPLAFGLSISPISCNGGSDAVIDLSITGGQGPITNIWTDSNGQSTGLEDLVGVEPGVFTLNIIDAFGCALDTTVTIAEPTSISISGLITTAACQGSSTGAVDASVNGGTTPYSYAWSGPSGFGASTEDVSGLAAGIYTLGVVDARGCVLNEAFNISQPGPLQLNANSSAFAGGWNVSCENATDGSIDLDVTGGTGPFDIQWSGPNGYTASIEDISGISSGAYTATVTDANGCTLQLTSTLTAPAQVATVITTSVFGGNNISCNGSSDGTVDATIVGGTAPFNTNWSGPNGFTSVVEDPSGLVAGTYAVLITDTNGCLANASVTLTEPQPLGTSVLTSTSNSGDAIGCQGDATGSIQLAVAGGSSPWNITWIGPNGFIANSGAITDLFAGTYDATISDANGCVTSTSITLTEPTSIAAFGTVGSFNGTNVSCASATDGSIDLAVSGGAGPYAFAWSGPNGFGSFAEDINTLAPGGYDVLVTDLNGCTSGANFQLDAPDTLTTILTSADFNGSNISCSGAADGSIDLTVGGGISPFAITWNGPNGFTSNNEDLSGLDAGTYTVDVADANGCSFSTSISLIAADPILLDLQAALLGGGNQVSCAGGTDGMVDLTITGGTAPFTISWTDGIGFTANTEDINSVGAGFYQASVSDANGCTQTANVLLNAPPALDLMATLSSINGNNVTCAGAADGSIDISVSGGVAPYTVTWNTGSTDEDLTGITAGTYDVTVTDANGCSANASYTLTAPVTVVADVTSSIQPGGNNITCAGGTNGTVDALITGGTAPYDIAWSGPNAFTSNSASLSGLAAGTYDLLVTDANGCSLASANVLTEPAPVTPTLSTVTYSGGFNIPCATVAVGVFNASATGGTPNYAYAWTGPNGFTSNDANLVSLVAGTYDLTVTDSNGCTGAASSSLTAPGALDVVLEFTDFNGSPVSCAGNDGAINLTVAGGTPSYQYDWTGPNGSGSQQEDLYGLFTGAYTLVVTDANGCSLDTTTTLAAPAPLQANFSNTSNICGATSAGAVDVTMAGGGAPYLYSWSGPNGFTSTDEDIAAIPNGTYTLTVNDGLGCNSTFSTSLTGPAPITSGTYVSFFGLYNLQCQGDSSGVIELTPQGGSTPFSLLINGPSGYTSSALQNTGLVAGDYSLTITDLNGCSMDTTITLTQPTTSVDVGLTLSVYPSGTNVSCYGASDGSIDASVSGGSGPYVFNWRGPDSLEFATEDVTGLPAGDYNYELVVTDANQCNFFTTVTLTQPDTALYATSVSTTFFGGFNTSCEANSDGAIDLTAAGGNGGYNYTWTGPNGFNASSEDVSELMSGTYIASITDINGCTVQHIVDLIAPVPIAPALDAFAFPGGTTISCQGATDGSIATTLSGGAAPYTYSWSGPNGFTSTNANISALEAGTYCLSVIDANGCTGQACTTLNAPVLLEASTTTVGAACATSNGAVDLTVTGGSAPFGFVWDNSETTEDLSGVAPGTFNVVVTDANGCVANASAVVAGSSGMNTSANVSDDNCFGSATGSVDLTVSSGTAPFSFSWSNGSTTEDLSGVAAGTYTVTITDGVGCTYSDDFTVQQPTAIAIDTLVSTFEGGYNVSGYGASDGSIATAVSGGASPYVFDWSNGATTESISGLTAGTYILLVTDASGCSASLEVTLTESIDLEMPTGFSPNGDGSNEFFVVRGIEGYSKNLLTVLNRWGNVVYEQPNYKNEWAGSSNQGEQLPNGTYFIILSINDGMRTLQGYVDLRR